MTTTRADVARVSLTQTALTRPGRDTPIGPMITRAFRGVSRRVFTIISNNWTQRRARHTSAASTYNHDCQAIFA